jgi:hypothetical protein
VIAVKLAATLLGPFITRLCGLAVPVTFPLKPWKELPELALAETVAVEPALYQAPGGVGDIVPFPVADVERKYWVANTAVTRVVVPAVMVCVAEPESDQFENTN